MSLVGRGPLSVRRAYDKILEVKLRLYFERQGGLKARAVPMTWLSKPRLARGDKACIFVAMPQQGRLLPHSVDHIRAWHAAGYRLVIVLVVDSLDAPLDVSPLHGIGTIAKRLNQGYDFGAWSAALHKLGRSTRRCSMLALTNDSMLGPSAVFPAMLKRVDHVDADVVGLTSSEEARPHFQSYLLFFKHRAVASRAFRTFWGRVRSGDRWYVIEHYETRVAEFFGRAGLSCATLFGNAGGDGRNATLVRWRELIGAGFPYFKTRLLRENTLDSPLDGWREVAVHGGFDLAALDRQIDALKQGLPGGWHV